MNDILQAIIFDLDDTLMVEEPGAEAAFMEVCEQAAQDCGVDANKLCTLVRETARDIWHQSPARPYCVEIGISSWEGVVARFEGNAQIYGCFVNGPHIIGWTPGLEH